MRYHIGDGTLGWPEKAPFDGIMVTAAAPEVPTALIEQLAENAQLVLPVGGQGHQTLYAYRRSGSQILQDQLCQCRFVPLIGEQGWPGRV